MEPQQKKRKDHSLEYFHAEAATSSVESGSIAYQAPSLIASGVSAQGVQMVSSSLNAVLALLCIKIPSIVGRTSGTKKTTTVLQFLNMLSWLPVVLIFFFMRPIGPFGLIAVFWLLNLIPSILLAPVRDSWLVGLVPKQDMRRYFGLRSAISSSGYLVSFCAMGYILVIVSGGQTLTGFGIVFAIATLAVFSSFLIYGRIQAKAGSATQEGAKPDQEEARSEQKGSKFSFPDFIRETRQGYLGTVILYSALFNFAMFIATPLLAVYILDELELGYFVFMMLICCEFTAKIIGSMFWRRYTGTNSNLGIICKVSPFLCLAPLLWLFSSNLLYLALIQVFTGVMWAGFELSYNVLIYEAAPEEKRLNYICYSRTMNTMAMALGSLAAIYLVMFMCPIMGSKILGLFLISGILRLVIVRFILPLVRDQQLITPRSPGSDGSGIKVPRSIFDSETPIPVPVLAQSSLQMPEEWAGFGWESSTTKRETTQDSFSVFRSNTVLTKKEIEALSLKQGLFFRPMDWAKINGKSTAPQTLLTRKEKELISSRQGLFFRPMDWHKFNGESVAPKPKISRNEIQVLSLKQGLFFRPMDWSKFSGKPTTPKLKVTQSEMQALSLKQGLFFRPMDWRKFNGEPIAPKPRMTQNEIEVLSSKQGLFFRPRPQSASSKSVTTKKEIEALSSKQGLYFRPRHWPESTGHKPVMAKRLF